MEAHSTVEIISEVDQEPLSEEHSDARWAAHAQRRRACNHALQLHLQARCRSHAADAAREESEKQTLELQLTLCQHRIEQARAAYERADAEQTRTLQHHHNLLKHMKKLVFELSKSREMLTMYGELRTAAASGAVASVAATAATTTAASLPRNSIAAQSQHLGLQSLVLEESEHAAAAWSKDS